MSAEIEAKLNEKKTRKSKVKGVIKYDPKDESKTFKDIADDITEMLKEKEKELLNKKKGFDDFNEDS